MSSGSFYKAVWRWHFYAGVFCVPFLLVLSATGGIYLFDKQIDAFLHKDLYRVTPESAPQRSASALHDAVRLGEGELLLNYFPPSAENRSAAFSLLDEHNDIRSVYLNPYSGAVLGSISGAQRLMPKIKEIHTLEIAGPIANRFVECVAGWAVLLVVTGVYLWWPRSKGDAFRVRGRPSKRPFWRDVHRIAGITAGAVIGFQALTGLPMTGVFGQYLHQGIEAAGQGIPPLAWNDRPESTLPTGGDGEPADIGLDEAMAIAHARNIGPAYAMSIPTYPLGVYTAMIYAPDDPAEQRVIHIDRYSGAVLNDITFRDFGAASKMLEYGKAIHMGNYFGTANRLVLLATCIAVWILCATGMVMWWKRRPASGWLSAPPTAQPREARVVMMIVVAVALLFPLTAVSLVAFVLIDRLALAGRTRRSANAPPIE